MILNDLQQYGNQLHVELSIFLLGLLALSVISDFIHMYFPVGENSFVNIYVNRKWMKKIKMGYYYYKKIKSLNGYVLRAALEEVT